MAPARTPKHALRKAKGKAVARPSQLNASSSSTYSAGLFEFRTARKANWLDRVLVALFVFYGCRERKSTSASTTISILQVKDLVSDVEKGSKVCITSPLGGSPKSRLTQAHNALATLSHHKLVKWHSYRDLEEETIELTEKLTASFDRLLRRVDADSRFGELSSLTGFQYSALYMWSKDYCKRYRIKNLTKHEGYMNQMDVEQERDDLQAQHDAASSSRAQSMAQGVQDDADRTPAAAASAGASTVRVPLPSRMPRTPQRPSPGAHINSATAYPTPESRPRKQRSEELHGSTSAAEPTIRALSLQPATSREDNASDTGDNDTSDNDINMDVPSPPATRPAPTHREITDLKNINETLASMNTELEAERVEKAQLQVEKEQLQAEKRDLQAEVTALKARVAELEQIIKVEAEAMEKKESELSKARQTEVYLRKQVDNFVPDGITKYEVLRLSHARYEAVCARLERELAQMQEEVRAHKEEVRAHKAEVRVHKEELQAHKDAQKRNLATIAALNANFVVV